MLDDQVHDMRSLIDELLGVHGIVRIKPIVSDFKPQIYFIFVFDGFICLFHVNFLEDSGRLLVFFPSVMNICNLSFELGIL
jgi:hypothetical protein